MFGRAPGSARRHADVASSMCTLIMPESIHHRDFESESRTLAHMLPLLRLGCHDPNTALPVAILQRPPPAPRSPSMLHATLHHPLQALLLQLQKTGPHTVWAPCGPSSCNLKLRHPHPPRNRVRWARSKRRRRSCSGPTYDGPGPAVHGPTHVEQSQRPLCIWFRAPSPRRSSSSQRPSSAPRLLWGCGIRPERGATPLPPPCGSAAAPPHPCQPRSLVWGRRSRAPHACQHGVGGRSGPSSSGPASTHAIAAVLKRCVGALGLQIAPSAPDNG